MKSNSSKKKKKKKYRKEDEEEHPNKRKQNQDQDMKFILPSEPTKPKVITWAQRTLPINPKYGLPINKNQP